MAAGLLLLHLLRPGLKGQMHSAHSQSGLSRLGSREFGRHHRMTRVFRSWRVDWMKPFADKELRGNHGDKTLRESRRCVRNRADSADVVGIVPTEWFGRRFAEIVAFL